MTQVTRADAARRNGWSRLSSTSRRRILLGSVLGVALAARDIVAILFAASFFAITELAPAPRPLPARGA